MSIPQNYVDNSNAWYMLGFHSGTPVLLQLYHYIDNVDIDSIYVSLGTVKNDIVYYDLSIIGYTDLLTSRQNIGASFLFNPNNLYNTLYTSSRWSQIIDWSYQILSPTAGFGAWVRTKPQAEVFPTNPSTVYMYIVGDQSSNLLDLKDLSNLDNLFAFGNKNNYSTRFDSSFNNSKTLPGLKIGTLKKLNGDQISLNFMLANSSLDVSISNWDVSAVTSMEGMFQNATCLSFGSITDWSVNKVTDMSGMFMGSDFNQDISSWDVSNLFYATNMFMDSSFNYNISNWNIANLFIMDGCYNNMFTGSTLVSYTDDSEISQQLEMINNDLIYKNWLKTIHNADRDLSYTTITSDFSAAGLKFPQPFALDNSLSLLYRLIIEDFCSNLILLSDFSNLDGLFDIGYIKDREDLDASFNNSTTLPGLQIGTMKSGDQISLDFMLANSSLDVSISNWDVSAVTSMQGMFQNATCLSFGSITDWSVNKVTDMSGMFRGSDFNQDINSWDVSAVTNMSYMFADSSFNKYINDWSVNNVINMKGMFSKSPFDQSLNHWDVSSVKFMQYMFADSSFNQYINDWSVNNVINMKGMFMHSVFDQSLNNWDVSNVTNMQQMFANSVFNQYINDWSVNNVTNMKGMFSNSPFDQSLNNWDVGKVIDMSGMFYDSSFNQDISGWDISNLFWSNHIDNSGNYQNIFINSGIFNAEPSFNINNNIWEGWSNKLNALPDLSSNLMNTGLRQKINLSLKFSYVNTYTIFNIFKTDNYIRYVSDIDYHQDLCNNNSAFLEGNEISGGVVGVNFIYNDPNDPVNDGYFQSPYWNSICGEVLTLVTGTKENLMFENSYQDKPSEAIEFRNIYTNSYLLLKVVLNQYVSDVIGDQELSLNIYNTENPDISQNFTIKPSYAYIQNNEYPILDERNGPPLYIIINIDKYGKFKISDDTSLLPNPDLKYFKSVTS